MYLLVSLGGRDDNGQDADELEDGPQEQAVAQQALQQGGLRDLGGRQVQLGGHGEGSRSDASYNLSVDNQTTYTNT